ncbi:hypothetical protein CVIRNUC_000742 [Coccomyxa viridis]|uniref:Uncharacterized protein n=1 Tax=Coccomyxa viridis TaxID=1274662 RepID=A0AAV1HUL9_9CHLO|nr:hypothetical protein CVIRNUC_000742 [Coccomyxa viridis]
MQGGRPGQLERAWRANRAELSAVPCASVVARSSCCCGRAAAVIPHWCSEQRARACAREAQERLARAWWEEKAELSAGPAEQGAGGRFSDAPQEPESGHTSWQAGTGLPMAHH